MSLALIPARFGFADQVLELPSAAAPPATSAAGATPPNDIASAPHPLSHHQTVAAVPANLGSLQDYERETDEDPSAGGPSNYANYASFAGAPTHPPFEINGNSQQSLAQNAILGVLLIGLFAMEANAGHHHHH